MSALPWLREAAASARAHHVHSTVIALVVGAVTAGVLLLIGQAHRQNQSVLDEFEQPQFRTVTLADSGGTAMDWRLAAQVRSLSGVEAAWTAGDAFEVTNSHLPGAARVSARMIGGDFASLPIRLASGRFPHGPDEALLDAAGAAALGLGPSGGAVETDAGRSWAVVGVYQPLHEQAPRTALMEPVGAAPVRSLSVVVRDASQRADALAAVTALAGNRDLRITGALPPDDLGHRIGRQVGDGLLAVIVLVLVVGLMIVGLLAALSVRSRAAEFGRRRALGASRFGLMGLVVAQGLVVVAPAGVVGALAGGVAGVAAFGWLVPWPVAWWLTSVLVLGSCLAQLPSAASAALRDPVRVLRTP